MRRSITLALILTSSGAILSSCGQSVSPTTAPLSPTPIPSTPIPTRQPETFVVTSADDSGPGTLRQALEDAQPGDTIAFDPGLFPPDQPSTISLATGLRPITQGNLTVDASNAGVILDGNNIAGDWTVGLEIPSDGNSIWGLQIVNFSGAGVVLGGGAQHNMIGGDRNAGSGPLGQGNLLSDNGGGLGVWDGGTSFNKITGNLIGTDVDGVSDRGNVGTGVYVSEGATYNVIGPDNVIAFNGEEGVQIYNPISIGNTITQNNIHDNGIDDIFLNDGGNANQRPPLIIDFSLAEGTVAGSACAGCMVEIFSDDPDRGSVFEGQAIADDIGVFMLEAGSAFAGTRLAATATSLEGNTSEFSRPTSGAARSLVLQDANLEPRTEFATMRSNELADNRIGEFPEMHDLREGYQRMLDTGYKWLRLELLKDGTNDGRFWQINWQEEPYRVDPEIDEGVTQLANNGVSLVACLGCLIDEGGHVERGRFKTEEEIQLYLTYVRQVAAHFRGRISYYEIWNEPNVQTPNWYVEVPDYINLVKRAMPVILEEDPDAKFVVASTAALDNQEALDHLFGILSSDLMPLVDVVSWHPFYGSSPAHDCCRDYYYEYPSIVQEIQQVASDHGFAGQYYAAEINWQSTDHPNPPEEGHPRHEEVPSAKYYARGILINLGLDVSAGIINWAENLTQRDVTRRLSTVMAGPRRSTFR